MITRSIEGLKKLWRGEQPLGRAFWVYFVVGQIGFVILSILVAMGLLVVGLRPIGILSVVFATFVYPVFAGIGVWRSANAYELHGFYPFLAKAVVLIVLVSMLWNLLNGGFENLILAFMG